jgi:hypothetical protein
LVQSVFGHRAPGAAACELAKAPVIAIAASIAAPVPNSSFCFVVIASSRAATLAAPKGVVAGRASVTEGVL